MSVNAFMPKSTPCPQCYITMQISVCDFTFVSSPSFFSSLQTVNSVLKKAMDLATEKELPWGPSSSKIYAYDDLTGQPLEGKQLLIHYYPEHGYVTIRVHIEDFLTRGVLSMD